MRPTAPALLAFALLAAGFSPTVAAPPSAKETAFFENKIRPLLAEHCYKCHSADEKVKGGLLLDSKAGWEAGGDSGDAIEPGNPGDSLLIKAVLHTDPDLQMPPKYKLADAEIEALTAWVKMGAPDPRTGDSGAVKQASEIDIAAGKQFWAFQPVKRVTAPQPKDAAWAKSDIDRHLKADAEARGLQVAGDANRWELIRRATFDLTGLPPSPEDIAAFVKDPASDDDAFAKVVDRLLKSPQFGERWGRHWLDVVRYAESMGRTRNVPFPFAWRFRDYVIDSFNADKPFNRFLGEQIAGDLLPHNTPAQRDEQIVATGFLALGSMDLNERDAAQFKMDQVDEQIDVTTRAFMAMTVGCARCHDHKFDPVAQEDYYALAGIFKSTEALSGTKNKGGGGNYYQPQFLATLSEGDSKNAEEEAQKEAAAQRKKLQNQIAEIKRQLGDKKKSADQQQLRKRLKRLNQELSSMGANAGKQNLAMAAEDAKNVSDCKLCVRGDPHNLGEAVPRGFLRVAHYGGEPDIPTGASGRLELAKWLASPEHPLTARVMANRVWQHLFGRGIVATVDNFGETGERPVNPALLDHLAVRFVEGGWSVKSLVREIMLSRAYRLSSGDVAANAAIDPGNDHFWRQNPRRLEVEAIRDSLLAIGGTLTLERPHGSPVQRARKGEIGKGGGEKADERIDAPFRSVYFPVIRSGLPEMFESFDFPEPSQVIGKRDVTTVSTQALFFMNSDLVREQANGAAKALLARAGLDPNARIHHTYAHALGRRPSAAEQNQAAAYLQNFLREAKDKSAEQDAWSNLFQALFASAEFRYVL
ncbi:MAG: PSD1 and planctomycete cytochrome C domain-containing protein [Verrucomicrobiales bacterium]